MTVTDPDVILGEGLVLRVPVRADRSRWLVMARDPDQLRFGSPAFVAVPETVEDLDVRIALAATAYASVTPGTLVMAGADEPDRLLGTIAWRLDVPPVLQVSDIGYSVHPDARGRGVARRALAALTRWLTTDPEGPAHARVQLDHSVENRASCRVALAAGFAQEGVRRAFLPLRDPDAPGGVRRHDVCLHGFVPGL